MKTVIDLDLHEAIQDFTIQSPAGTYDFKSQDTVNWMIYFVRGGIVQDLGAGMAIKFGMIVTGDASNILLAYQTAFTYLTDSNGNVYYECSVNFNTSQMATAITGKSQLPCTAEIRYQTPDVEIIHSLNISCLVFPTILIETGVTPPNVSTGYPDASTLELLVHKGVANGYAGLDSTAHVPTTLLPTGIELITHKDQPSGYPSLDSTGLIPPAEIPIDNSTIVLTSGKLSAPFVGGDMKKSVYDLNNDGVVDHAVLADTATLATTATTAGALTTVATSAPISTVWGRDASGKQNLFAATGGGDMTKAVYDTNNDGIVDVAAALRQDAGPGALSTVWGRDASGKQNLFTAPVAGGTPALTPDQGVEDWDYFGQGTLAPRWSNSSGGGGAVTFPSAFGHDSTNKNLYGVDLACAAANASYAQMWFGPPAPKGFPGALGILTFECRVCLQSVPSAGTDCPRIIFGIGNYFNPGIVDQCIVFQYNLGNNANWQMYVSGNGTSTAPYTSIVPDTNFHKYKIVSGSAAWDQPFTFYIDGLSVGTANLGAGNFWTENYQPIFMITKANGSTAAFKITVGWAHWKYQVAT